jgi:hypothetical protein
MEEAFWLFFWGCVAFTSGYGVRAMISLRHRREARKIGEASARLKQVVKNQSDSSPDAGRSP